MDRQNVQQTRNGFNGVKSQFQNWYVGSSFDKNEDSYGLTQYDPHKTNVAQGNMAHECPTNLEVSMFRRKITFVIIADE